MVFFRVAAVAFALLFLSTALGEELKKTKMGRGEENTSRSEGRKNNYWVHKKLSGPGSHPPTCHARCEGCYPCKPVHVTIHPGLITPLEYYPEAWRCKCRNNLYMP